MDHISLLNARNYVVLALAAYLCGSIPFGYILVKIFRKQDIRTTGSGNIGATNVARAAPVLGVATLILDAAKGFLPVHYGLFYFFPIDTRLVAERAFHYGVVELSLALLCVVLGHMFPVWLGFKGGKGVATAVGAFLAVKPEAVGCAFVLFILVLLVSRYVSAASIFAAIAFPILAWFIDGFPLGSSPVAQMINKDLMWCFCAVSIFIILKHHANIRRLLNGTENKFGGKKRLEAVVKED